MAIVANNVPKANAAVLEVMLLGGWWTLAELAERTGLSEASVSARIRENGWPEPKGYGYPYLKRVKVGSAARSHDGQPDSR